MNAHSKRQFRRAALDFTHMPFGHAPLKSRLGGITTA